MLVSVGGIGYPLGIGKCPSHGDACVESHRVRTVTQSV